MQRPVIATVILAIVAASPPARAQEGSAEPPADVAKRYTDQLVLEPFGEVRFSAIIDDDDDRMFDLVIGPGIGIFVVKGLEIGLQPQLRYYRIEDEDGWLDQVGGGLGLFLHYVIDVRSILFPYVGVNFAATGGEVDAGGFLGQYDYNQVDVGPVLGLKIIIGRNGILTIGFSYTFASTGYESIDNRAETHTFWIGTALGFWASP